MAKRKKALKRLGAAPKDHAYRAQVRLDAVESAASRVFTNIAKGKCAVAFSELRLLTRDVESAWAHATSAGAVGRFREKLNDASAEEGDLAIEFESKCLKK